MKPIHLKDIRGRKLEDMAPNELRAMCIRYGVTIPNRIKTKKDLVKLVKEKCR